MDTSKKNNKKPAEEAKKDEIYSGLFQPQKGSSRVFSFGEGMNKVSVVELDDNLNLKDSVLISGFPESSLTCVLTTGYLADVLKLPTVAVIECSSFPALAIIENGTPLPPVRIMGTKDIVVVQCEFKLPSDEIQENVVAAVLDFSHRHGIRLFFTIDGIPTKQMDPEGTKVMRFITSDEKFSKYMLGKGHNGVKDGIVSALTARILLANSMGRSTVPVACLLGTFAEVCLLLCVCFFVSVGYSLELH